MRHMFDWIVYGFVVAGILVLTRPGSQGPGLVKAIGGSLVNFAQAVTGQKTSKVA